MIDNGYILKQLEPNEKHLPSCDIYRNEENEEGAEIFVRIQIPRSYVRDYDLDILRCHLKDWAEAVGFGELGERN